MTNYNFEHGCLTIYQNGESVFLQGDEAVTLFDQLEAAIDEETEGMIISDYF